MMRKFWDFWESPLCSLAVLLVLVGGLLYLSAVAGAENVMIYAGAPALLGALAYTGIRALVGLWRDRHLVARDAREMWQNYRCHPIALLPVTALVFLMKAALLLGLLAFGPLLLFLLGVWAFFVFTGKLPEP